MVNMRTPRKSIGQMIRRLKAEDRTISHIGVKLCLRDQTCDYGGETESSDLEIETVKT